MGLMDKLPDPYTLYKNMPWPEKEYVSREEWGAQPPKSVEEYEKFPVKNIILGYTETDACDNKEDCIRLMQELQKKHMSEGEPDIRYSYVVGLDQRVYVGRGFKVKAGTNPRYPHLKGTNVEVVLTGQRGVIPRPGENSAIMHHIIDQAGFDGIVEYQHPNYVLDYDDREGDTSLKLQAETDEMNKKIEEVVHPIAEEFRKSMGLC